MLEERASGDIVNERSLRLRMDRLPGLVTIPPKPIRRFTRFWPFVMFAYRRSVAPRIKFLSPLFRFADFFFAA